MLFIRPRIFHLFALSAVCLYESISLLAISNRTARTDQLTGGLLFGLVALGALGLAAKWSWRVIKAYAE